MAEMIRRGQPGQGRQGICRQLWKCSNKIHAGSWGIRLGRMTYPKSLSPLFCIWVQHRYKVISKYNGSTRLFAGCVQHCSKDSGLNGAPSQHSGALLGASTCSFGWCYSIQNQILSANGCNNWNDLQSNLCSVSVVCASTSQAIFMLSNLWSHHSRVSFVN